MMPHVLIDTGPLVASINRNDRYHAWTRDALAKITPPLLTCEPVLAEASFLLQRCPGGSAALLKMVHRGIVKVEFHLDGHAAALNKLMKKYAGVPMSLADACLVRMSELESQCSVLTFDSDFRVYRRHGRQVIPVMMAEPE